MGSAIVNLPSGHLDRPRAGSSQAQEKIRFWQRNEAADDCVTRSLQR